MIDGDEEEDGRERMRTLGWAVVYAWGVWWVLRPCEPQTDEEMADE